MNRRNGFTLLELVISCAALIGLFTVLTMMLTQAHRLRTDDRETTRLLTEGRVFLDRLADEIRNADGTNLFLRTTSGEDESSGRFDFIRTRKHPRGAEGKEMATNTPFERISYTMSPFDRHTNGGFRKATSTWTTSETSPTSVPYATEYTFKTNRSGATMTVTNVHASTDKVGIHGASKGDVVTIPVTSGCSKGIYETVDAAVVQIDIVPTDSPLTNRLLAAVTFTNAFSSVATNVIRRPLAGPWSPPREGLLRLQRRQDLLSETKADGNELPPLVLLYTNSVVSMAATNLFAYTNAPDRSLTVITPGMVRTNATTGLVTTNYPIRSYPTTNIAARTLWTVTNISCRVSNGKEGAYPEGLAVFFTSGPVVRTNYWRTTPPPGERPADESVPVRPDDPPSTEDGTIPGRPAVPPVETGGTNSVPPGHAVDEGGFGIDMGTWPFAPDAHFPSDGVGGPAVPMDGLLSGLHSEDLFELVHPVPAPSIASNLLSAPIPPMVFPNRIVARTAVDGPPLPFAFYRQELVEGSEGIGGLTHETSGDALAIGIACGDVGEPIVRFLQVTREQGIDLYRAYAEEGARTNFTTICSNRYHSVASFRFQMDIPAYLAGTNRYEYLQDDSGRIRRGTTGSQDTTWETIVLDEDLPATLDDLVGLWLETEERDGSGYEVEKRTLYKPVGRPAAETREQAVADMVAESVYKLEFIPLAFEKTGEKGDDGDPVKNRGDFQLVEWDPEKEGMAPPVCVDIHLELLSSLHKRRANAIVEAKKREEYIDRHLIFLDRRVPLHGRNLWRPPR